MEFEENQVQENILQRSPEQTDGVQTYGHLSLNTCSGSRYGALMFLSSIT